MRKSMVIKMAVSNWYLYVGIFLACTGVLTIPGVVMIGYWFVKYFMDKGGVKGINTDKVKEIKSNYRKQTDRVDQALKRVGELQQQNQQDYVEEKRLESWR
jgi:Tfp pilus assembly protein PilO